MRKRKNFVSMRLAFVIVLAMRVTSVPVLYRYLSNAASNELRETAQ